MGVHSNRTVLQCAPLQVDIPVQVDFDLPIQCKRGAPARGGGGPLDSTSFHRNSGIFPPHANRRWLEWIWIGVFRSTRWNASPGFRRGTHRVASSASKRLAGPHIRGLMKLKAQGNPVAKVIPRSTIGIQWTMLVSPCCRSEVALKDDD
jgi:hypothetical protein